MVKRCPRAQVRDIWGDVLDDVLDSARGPDAAKPPPPSSTFTAGGEAAAPPLDYDAVMCGRYGLGCGRPPGAPGPRWSAYGDAAAG